MKEPKKYNLMTTKNKIKRIKEALKESKKLWPKEWKRGEEMIRVCDDCFNKEAKTFNCDYEKIIERLKNEL